MSGWHYLTKWTRENVAPICLFVTVPQWKYRLRPEQNNFRNAFFNCFFLNDNYYCISIDLLHKSHNAPIPNPTMHHVVTEVCTCVHISVTKWCIVGFLSDALWVLWDGSIQISLWGSSDNKKGLASNGSKAIDWTSDETGHYCTYSSHALSG